MKYRLSIDMESAESLTTWDMHGLPHFLALALADVAKSDVTHFELTRLDGPSIAGALERCVEVNPSLLGVEMS